MEKTKTKKCLLLFALSVLSGFSLSSLDYFSTPEFTSTIQTNILPAERYKYKISEEDKIIHLEPNSTKQIKLKIKNTGKSTWNTPTTVTPGSTTTLPFTLTAPATPGFYNHPIKPLVADPNWTVNNQLNIGLIVDGDMDKSYQYKLLNPDPISLLIKDTKQITLKIKNTGKVAWQNHGKFSLYLAPKMATAKFGLLATTMQEYEVHPGQTATFVFNLTSPDFLADYQLGFGLSINDLYSFKEPIVIAANISTKKVALTFDDGYGDIDAFINLLNEQHVRATFFMLGCVAENQPAAMRRIVNEGHLLASHSYCHPDFRTLTDDEIRWQLNHTREIMKDITGTDVYPNFRYPYGAMNERTNALLKEEGWTYYHWTQSTGDYKHHANTAAGRQQIYYYSTLNPPDSSNVLMHIISKSSLATLPNIIKWYRDHDYSFVTVDQL